MAYELFKPTWEVRMPVCWDTDEYGKRHAWGFDYAPSPEFRRILIGDLADLCKRVKVPIPIIKLRYHPGGSWYHSGWSTRSSWLSIAFNGPDTYDTMLHELSHHIVRCRRLKGSGSHGSAFRRVLWRLAIMYYGDPSVYNWEKDYKMVKNWAYKKLDKLTNPIT